MSSLKSWRVKHQLAPYLFISPFFLLFFIFMLYPFFYAFVISFADWNGIGLENIKWVGLDNYIKLVKDKVFIQSLINGVILYIMYVPILVVLSILMAVILNKAWLCFRGFFRAAIYIPNITSTVAAAYVFSLIFSSSENGIINILIRSLGIDAIVSWFASAGMARLALCILMIWRWLGYDTILMMAGLNAISTDVFEAAVVDGANSPQIFLKITLPLMKHYILFTCIMSTIGTFSMFTEPKILTGGGPINTTISTVLYLYETSFKYLRMGYSSSMAFVYFIIMLVFTILQLKVGNHDSSRERGLRK